MATCKDCVHYDVCLKYISLIAEEKIYKPLFPTENAETTCEHFKDRSRSIDLPCKLGEKVYYFDSAGTIYSQKVEGFIVNYVGILVDSDVMFDSNLIGERFFFTPEEAEQAMKECEV